MLYLFLVFFSEANARSLRSSAERLGQETSKIGLALAIFGLALGGIYLILGRQDASQKISASLVGILLLSLAPSIVSFLKGIS
ncbi:MAG: hypothetical protein NXH75_14905 [Halobacteriovoraceae bacterium]|nr:hypothetical protein [Halobacteriovoraceae bacterium]